MLEGATMEYGKWFIGMISAMFIGMAVIFMFRLNEVNSFQQEVNYQIERHGGLTEEAKKVLNEHAKKAYGGCLVDSGDSNAQCLFAEDRANHVESSGFFIREYKETSDGKLAYYDRTNEEQARYGTPIRYVLSRQIGNIGDGAFIKPAVLGISASRVRGVAEN